MKRRIFWVMSVKDALVKLWFFDKYTLSVEYTKGFKNRMWCVSKVDLHASDCSGWKTHVLSFRK